MYRTNGTDKLYYTSQATKWTEALPLGNGRLGAMVFGIVDKDRIQINEDTIWYGGPQNRVNHSAYENLEKVRSLIMDGEIQQAEELLRYAFTGNPFSMRHYQTGGDFWLRPRETGPVTDYERTLSLRDAVAQVKYKQGEVTYTRTYFISQKLQTLIVEVSADRAGAVNVDGQITREKKYDSVSVTDDIVMLKGNLGKGGLDFALAYTATSEGGTVQVIGENIVVRNADKARFYIAEATTFQEYLDDFIAHDADCNPEGERLAELGMQEVVWRRRLAERLIETLIQAKKVPYCRALEEHISNHGELYNRVCLRLEPAAGCSVINAVREQTTDARLAAIKQGADDNELMTLYFNYGRYLMITGSRPGTLPLNLQGIWNDKMQPPWDSKYTININTEMNYWPAEICNLPECHEPLFDLLRRTVKRGQKTAWEMYHCRGFVIHHNTDIWADTAPQDIWMPGTYWVMGGAWLCAHIWMHYEYNQDIKFLASMYDVLEQAVLFFCDYMYEKDDRILLCPSVSPENTYILPNGNSGCVCYNSTMDIMILRELLQNFIAASELLSMPENVDVLETMKIEKPVIQENLVQNALEMLPRLPEPRIGKYGQIMEWGEDYEEKDKGHRHISHLYGLHPGSEITVDGTPELAQAARVTLERRLAHGGGYTGWSCAWLINFYAKLWDGENAYKMLKKLLSESTDNNLMDTHPGKNGSVFQIDGNMGACAAIIHMLIQSNAQRVILLPSCPEVWNTGSLQGVKVVGNALFDFAWKDCLIVSCRIHAASDWKKEIHYNGKRVSVTLKAGECFTLV
ncbi:MAG: glycoside hydrolase family 95 protein [Lachnospiraceae bacterium]|nr:glycoside hydrolase family 95 protein [Lachnospiraceae bacterium]